MASSKDFEQQDRKAAVNFASVAKRAGVQRIIYLGGLGDDADPKLSPHLRSRHEVGDILRKSGVETIEFRAGMVLGAGSASYQLMKSLTDRLPVMLCPEWLEHADSADCSGRRTGLSTRSQGFARRRKPHLRDWRHGCGQLRRLDSRICPSKKAAALADLGAGADALPFQPVAGAGDAGELRSGQASDRRLEESDRGSRPRGVESISDPSDGRQKSHSQGDRQLERVIHGIGSIYQSDRCTARGQTVPHRFRVQSPRHLRFAATIPQATRGIERDGNQHWAAEMADSMEKPKGKLYRADLLRCRANSAGMGANRPGFDGLWLCRRAVRIVLTRVDNGLQRAAASAFDTFPGGGHNVGRSGRGRQCGRGRQALG